MIVNAVRRAPLRKSADAVPVLSARMPKGTALSGKTPKLIIAIDIILPRISGTALI